MDALDAPGVPSGPEDYRARKNGWPRRISAAATRQLPAGQYVSR